MSASIHRQLTERVSLVSTAVQPRESQLQLEERVCVMSHRFEHRNNVANKFDRAADQHDNAWCWLR
jgi:hypothetical protein